MDWCYQQRWNTATNWNPNTVPTASNVVAIPSGRPYMPIISASAEAYAVIVNPGASLTINNAGSLALNGYSLYWGTIDRWYFFSGKYFHPSGPS
jgi:hypothetical protein